jgi:hypothetical protein
MKNSAEWIDRIVSILFSAEDRRINAAVSELNRRNGVIKNKPTHGFMHMGNTFVPEDSKQQFAMMKRARQVVPVLALELMQEGNDLITDMRKSSLERDQIKQMLYKLLKDATCLQEIRDSLPDSVVALIPELKRIPRSNPDQTWLIRNDERALKQHQKMLPIMEMYAVSQMIF